MVRQVPGPATVALRGLAGAAEVFDQVLSLFEILLQEMGVIILSDTLEDDTEEVIVRFENTLCQRITTHMTDSLDTLQHVS